LNCESPHSLESGKTLSVGCSNLDFIPKKQATFGGILIPLMTSPWPWPPTAN